MTNEIVGAGLRGIHAGFAQATQAANDMASSFLPESTADFTEAAISLIGAETQIKASREVVRIGSEIDRSVLDILA